MRCFITIMIGPEGSNPLPPLLSKSAAFLGAILYYVANIAYRG